MKSKFIFAAGTAALLFATGCVHVKPWERGTLTDYTMQPGHDAVATAQAQHIFFSREEATGGNGVGGGGCGCN